MGTVVQLPLRPQDAEAKTEAILTKIGQLYQQKTKAKDELPGVLAQLLAAGAQELVHRSVMLWGSGEMEAHEVLALCEREAAVSGIKLVGNRPF